MNISGLTTLGKRTRRSRLVARVIAPFAVAAGCLSMLAGGASADQFSPFSGVGVHVFNNQFGDTCQLIVGPVYDPYGTPSSYAIIGGVTIQGCSRKHTFKVTVYEAYWHSPMPAWSSPAGTARQTTFVGVYGFGGIAAGSPNGRLLETARICNIPSSYWYTGSTVDEYDASGRFLQEVSRLSFQSQQPVRPKQGSSC